MSQRETIQECTNQALLVLREIATNNLEDTENRIKAAEIILEYTAKQNDDSGDNTTTEAIGFDLSLTSVDADAVYEHMRKYGKNLSEAIKLSLT